MPAGYAGMNPDSFGKPCFFLRKDDRHTTLTYDEFRNGIANGTYNSVFEQTHCFIMFYIVLSYVLSTINNMHSGIPMSLQTCCGFVNLDAFKHDKVLFIESTCIMIPPCTLQGTSVARAAHGTSCRQGIAASWRVSMSTLWKMRSCYGRQDLTIFDIYRI